jgi:DNA-binding Lrp family transcriptional regulator
MPSAFVLINVDFGTDILEQLKKINEVVEALNLYGTYDVIAHVKAEDSEKLKEIILLHIRRLKGVRATLTLMVIEEQKR